MSVIIFLVILGIMVTVHEFGHFLAARLSGVRVEIFSIGFGKALFKRQFDSCEFRLCIIPLGGYVKLHGDEPSEAKGDPDEFLSQSKRKRAFIVGLGPVFNYLLAWLLFCLVFMVGLQLPSTKIGSLLEDQPAAAVGLLEGDVVTTVNNESAVTWSDVVSLIHKNKSQELNISIDRDGEELEFSISPETRERKDVFGRKRSVSFVGIGPSADVVDVQHGFIGSLVEGTKTLFMLTGLTVKGLWFMVTGVLPFKESVTGPLGIYFITKQAAEIGIGALLHLMAVISMSLGIFNLLPLPVLDGGHLFFIVVEAIRRKPLADKTQDKVNQVGFVLMMALMVFVIANDVRKFFFTKTVQQTEQVSDEEK